MVTVNVANLKERCKNGELDLSSCGLKEIPKEILNFKNLQGLNLSNNKISSVGKFIGTLSHLTKLDLSKNSIKGLPESIGNLSNLKHLNLSHNQISILPASIGNLKTLKHLDLKNNPLAQKFGDVVGSCQNESQCQQAAKSVLKLFSSAEIEKKSKKQNEPELKKKNKTEKKQNGTATKAKDRKLKKDQHGIFGKLVSTMLGLLKTIFIAILVVATAVYLMSFYDEPRYKAVKAKFLPVWKSATSQMLTTEQTAKLEAVLGRAGAQLNTTIVTGAKLVKNKSEQLYSYLTTDETVKKYMQDCRKIVAGLWQKATEFVNSVISPPSSPTAGGRTPQKSKS